MINDTIKLLSLEHLEHLIETIDVVQNEGTIECHIELKKQALTCKHCGSKVMHIHGHKTKQIIHSINTRSKCILVISYRIQKCPLCGKTICENINVSSAKQRISIYTKVKVLEKLKDASNTFTGVGSQFNITAQSVINIFDEFVQPQRLKLPEYICMDEFYLGKRSKHKYACVLLDFEKRKIIEVFDTRHKYPLTELLFHIPLMERGQVKAVIIDMWESYKHIINRCFPNALIAVDSFHVVWHMNEAIKAIRIRVASKYKLDVSRLVHNDMYYYMLKKFHFFFIVDFEKLADRYRIPKLNTHFSKSNLLQYVLSIDEELKAAYLLKESYREFNKTADYETCEARLDELTRLFRLSKSPEMKRISKLLKHWKIEIINSFIRVGKRRLSNGPIENMNSQIKTIMKTANGYKDFGRLRNRIIYSLNKDTPIKG